MTPGDRLRQLHGALVDGFDMAALDELATLYLGTPLEQIVGAGCDLNGAALGLVVWARQRGKMGALMAGMLALNPTNAAVQAVALAGWNGDGREAARTGQDMPDFQERGRAEDLPYLVGTLVGAVRRIEGAQHESHTVLHDMDGKMDGLERKVNAVIVILVVLIVAVAVLGLLLVGHVWGGWWAQAVRGALALGLVTVAGAGLRG